MATNSEELWSLDYGAMGERIVDVSIESRLSAGKIAEKMGISASKMSRFRQGDRPGVHLIIAFCRVVDGQGTLRQDLWGIVNYVLGNPAAALPVRARLVGDQPVLGNESESYPFPVSALRPAVSRVESSRPAQIERLTA